MYFILCRKFQSTLLEGMKFESLLIASNSNEYPEIAHVKSWYSRSGTNTKDRAKRMQQPRFIIKGSTNCTPSIWN